MSDRKRNLSARVEAYQFEGLDQLAEAYGLNRSHLLRRAVDDFLENHEEDDAIPDWVGKEITHDELVNENSWKMRRMHFATNLAERLDELLEEKRRPPRPEWVREDFGESLRRQVNEEFPERKESYLLILEQELLRYDVLHPDTPTGKEDIRNALVAYHLNDDKAAANELCRSLKNEHNDVIHVTTSTIDHIDKSARQESAQEQWASEWRESVPGAFTP